MPGYGWKSKKVKRKQNEKFEDFEYVFACPVTFDVKMAFTSSLFYLGDN